MPWRVWRGEIELLPISSQTLFRRSGLPIDLLEIDLKSEGYLCRNENLLEVLKDAGNLKRYQFGSEEEAAELDNIGDFPDDWTDEDYQYFYQQKESNG